MAEEGAEVPVSVQPDSTIANRGEVKQNLKKLFGNLDNAQPGEDFLDNRVVKPVTTLDDKGEIVKK